MSLEFCPGAHLLRDLEGNLSWHLDTFLTGNLRKQFIEVWPNVKELWYLLVCTPPFPVVSELVCRKQVGRQEIRTRPGSQNIQSSSWLGLNVSPALEELRGCRSCPAGGGRLEESRRSLAQGLEGDRTRPRRGPGPGHRPPRTPSRTWSRTWSRIWSRTSDRTRSCTQFWSQSDRHCHTRSEARDLIWPATCSVYKARYQNNSNRLQSSSGTFWSI